VRVAAEHPDLLTHVARQARGSGPCDPLPWWRRISWRDPASVFTGVALIVGALLVGVTPPFQVPDEPNHFYRAFQVSEGRLVPQKTPTSVGGLLPRSLQELSRDVMGNVPFNPEVKQDLTAWARAFEMPLRPDDRIDTPFPNTALSGPIAYVPQAIGINFARIVGASTLMVFYWGRISTLLLCIAVTAVAIRCLPIRRWTCVLLSLLPMTVFVRSSLSSDGPTLALAMLALAICLKPADLSAPSVDAQGRRRLFGVAALLALGKPPYGVVTLLALATPSRILGGLKPWVSTMLALAVTLVALQGAWGLAMRGKTVVSAPGADPQAQLKHVREHPLDVASFLVKDFLHSIPRLTHQALGVLGWLDAEVPRPVALFLGMLIVLVALGEPGLPPMYPGFRWLALSIGIAGALALQVLNFVWWTPPGATFVAGIQGRHLLAFVPFLFVAIDSPDWIARPLSRLRPVFIVTFLVVSGTATLLTVVNRYYEPAASSSLDTLPSRASAANGF